MTGVSGAFLSRKGVEWVVNMLTLVLLAFGEWGTDRDGGREGGRSSLGAGKANALGAEAQAPALGDLGEAMFST